MLTSIDVKSDNVMSRAYRQRARRASAARTRDAIVNAAVRLAGEKLLPSITLTDVAERSGVTVQTVLRRFGSREALIAEAVQSLMVEGVAQRPTASGDVADAVSTVVEQYEQFGETMLLLLGQERVDPQAAAITEHGRRLHDQWVRAAFASVDETKHRLLVIATDLYSWKLLRRDRRLSIRHTKEHMRMLCRMIING
jgi:AcrR family transcriptional regulator